MRDQVRVITTLKLQTKLEAAVLSDVLRSLATDKRVVWHGRFNSGRGKLNGNQWFVANRCFLNTCAGAIPSICPDVLAVLTSGHLAAIEVKRESWKKPTTDTELKQLEMLEALKQAGCIAGFVRSVQELNQLIQQAEHAHSHHVST